MENGFELKMKSWNDKAKYDEAVVICCPTPGEKRAWIKDVRTHIKDWQSREAKRRQNLLRGTSLANIPTPRSSSHTSVGNALTNRSALTARSVAASSGYGSKKDSHGGHSRTYSLYL